ncbi:MAG: tetratricopeptide repeat protein [Bacteroidia bacterium]|nr:tetratricopeptide repeat protein [Bacteroidia bacterium]
MPRFIAILSLILLLRPGVQAQDNPISVNKKAQLDTTADFSKRIRILNSLAYNYGLSQMDSALKYANQAISESEKADDQVEVGRAIGMMGILYEKMGDYVKANEYQQNSLEILEAQDDKEGIGSAFMQFGNINLFYGRYEKALDYYFQSLEIFEKTGNEARIAGNLNNIGVIYHEKKEFDKATEYLTKALEVNQKLGNKIQEGRCYNNLGLIQTQTGNYDEGLELFEKAEEIYRQQGNLRGLGSVLTNKGKALSMLGDLETGREVTMEGRNYFQEVNDQVGLADNYYDWGLALQKHGQFQGAIREFQTAMKYALTTESVPQRMEIHQGMAESWAELDKTDSAYAHYLAYTALKDSIFNLETENQIRELEARYAMAKKEQEIEKLSHQNDLQGLQLERNRNYFYFATALATIILLSLVILLLYFSRFRIKASQKTSQLEQKLLRSQMNPHFIYNSLNSIQHYIYARQPLEAGTYLAKFADLIRMILESSRDESVTLDKEIRLLNVYLELQKLRFEELFDYELEIDPALNLENIKVPPMLAQPFIENAIEHAFQGMQNGGIIHIRFSKKGEQVLFEIEDNGIGIIESRRIRKADPNRKSLALEITRERLDFLKMTRKFNVQFRIEDKTEAGLGETGTRVTFFLPGIA